MGLIEIKVADQVTQYSTYEDGETVCRAIQAALHENEQVAVSFERVVGVPSSFINGLLNDIIADIGLTGIKQRIQITHSTKIINEMLKRKFSLATEIQAA